MRGRARACEPESVRKETSVPGGTEISSVAEQHLLTEDGNVSPTTACSLPLRDCAPGSSTSAPVRVTRAGAHGTPERVAKSKKSHTAEYLAAALGDGALVATRAKKRK